MSKQIKICYLLNDFMTGGVSTVVYDTLSKIDLVKYEVSVVLLSDKVDFLQNHPLPKEIKVLTCPYEFETNYSLRRYALLAFNRNIIANRAQLAIETILEIDPDIIHTHVLPRELMIGKLINKQKPKIKLVYTDHSVRIADEDYTYLNRTLLGYTYKSLYQSYNVIAVSNQVLSCQKKYHWLNKTKQHQLIENRIALEDYPAKIYNEKEELIIIYVARLSAVKDHKMLLETWLALQLENARLQLIGDGEMMNELKIYCDELEIKDVEFVGSVDNVIPYLLQADIAVFPSKKEGLPIALLEKMAVGLPVIIRNIPELSEYITINQNGLIFNNRAEFKIMIQQLIDSNELRRKLGTNARMSIHKRIGLKSYVREIEDYYKRLHSK